MSELDILLSPGEVCEQLKLKDSTLRKYVGILEAAGYVFSKNNRGHRQYREKDVIALRKFISASERTDMTLELAAEQLVSMYKKADVTLNGTKDIPIHDHYTNDIAELRGTINKQNDLILMLVQRLEEKDRYEKERDKRLNQRLEEIAAALDQQEKQTFMLESTKKELQAVKEEMAASKEEREAEKKKGLFSRLLGR